MFFRGGRCHFNTPFRKNVGVPQAQEVPSRSRKSLTVNANDLLDRFVELAPEFRSNWDSDENCFIGDDGHFTLHGVCAEFSHFFRDNHEELSAATMTELFEFIESNVVEPNAPETNLDNALCTCFLENISSERCGETAKPFMGRKAREFFDQWHTGPPY